MIVRSIIALHTPRNHHEPHEYHLQQENSGRFTVYMKVNDAKKIEDQMDPLPDNLDDVWMLISNGHKVRMKANGPTYCDSSVLFLKRGTKFIVEFEGTKS